MLKKTVKNVKLALFSTAILMISQGLGAKDQVLVGKEWDQCINWGYYRDILNEKSETKEKEIDFISRKLMEKRSSCNIQELKSRIRLISGSEKKESEAGAPETGALPDSISPVARNEETKRRIDDFFSKLGYEEESKKFSIDGDKEPLEVAKGMVKEDVEMWRSVMGCLMSEDDVNQYIRGAGDSDNNLNNVSYEWYKKQPEGFKLAWVRAAIETMRVKVGVECDNKTKEEAAVFIHKKMMREILNRLKRCKEKEWEFNLIKKHLLIFCRALFFVGGLKKEQTPENEVQNIKKIEEWVDENCLKGWWAASVVHRTLLVEELKKCMSPNAPNKTVSLYHIDQFARICMEKMPIIDSPPKGQWKRKRRQLKKVSEERWRAGQKKSPKKPKGKRRKSNRRLTKYTKKYTKTKKTKGSRNRR